MKKSTLKTLARTRTMVAALESKLKKAGASKSDRAKSKTTLAPIKALLSQLEQIAQRSGGATKKKSAASTQKTVKKQTGKKPAPKTATKSKTKAVVSKKKPAAIKKAVSPAKPKTIRKNLAGTTKSPSRKAKA